MFYSTNNEILMNRKKSMNQKKSTMDRKTFIQKAAGAMFIAIPAYSLLGCSSSDDSGENQNQDTDANADCLANGTAVSIGSNHGRSLTVSMAGVQSGAAKTYSIKGTSGHNHTVSLTAANFTALQGNTNILVTSSSDDGHSHSVQVSCA